MTRERIVLVEDDADLASTLGLALEREGYEIVSYPTGREGLVGILGNPPDLVLLDLNLLMDLVHTALSQAADRIQAATIFNK